jgi:signal transduction histidine kinase/CheY-like chemotaxis protein
MSSELDTITAAPQPGQGANASRSPEDQGANALRSLEVPEAVRIQVWRFPRSRPSNLLELACQVVHASFGGMALLSAGGELVEHLTAGLSDDTADALGQSAWLTNLLGLALPRPGPGVLDAGVVGPVLPGVPAPSSLLTVPLSRPGRFRGLLYLARPAGEPAFNGRDQELVLPVCACLASGALFEEAYLLSQLRLLNQVARMAAGNLSLGPLLDMALRELDRHLPMNLFAVWLAEESETPRLLGGATDGPPSDVRLVLTGLSAAQSGRAREMGLVRGLALPLGQTPFGPCWQEGGAVYTVWTRPTVEAGPAAAGPRSWAGGVPCFATPLRAGEQNVGILHCLCNRPGGFTSQQVQMLYLIADLLGPAISNCRLFARSRSMCEELRATQQELVRSEKLRAMGEMASGMAHDFNNSLCGVLGFLELTLREEGLSSVTRGNLEMARTCALDAAQTVRRVQDFARVRRDEHTFQVLDVGALARSAVELARPKWDDLARLHGRPITLDFRAEAARPVHGNAAELREVLTNLLFNAADAMPQGGTLRVRTWGRGADVFVSVSDTGVGMSAAVQQRLFEPFFTTKGERGNGLGLSVAFGIVRQHGGDIRVETEPGRGSTFTVRLPAAEGEAVPEREASAAGRSAPPTTAARVLVVEDEGAVGQMLEMALRRLGHVPRLARSGEEAVEVFRREKFDVVLTDLGLPGLSGEDVARAVRQQAPAVPVILLTGWADQLRAGEKALPNVTRLLGKPVTLQNLAEALAAVCPRAGATAPA